MIDDITTKIDAAKLKRRQNKKEAYQVGKVLYDENIDNLQTLLSTDTEEREKVLQLADKFANEILQCGIDYFKANNNKSVNIDAKSLELMKNAGQVPSTRATKERIDDNVQGVKDWQLNNEVPEEEEIIYNFDKIRLQTAFSFMTCDGDIDPNEIALIRSMANEKSLFGDINIDIELDFLVEIINIKGKGFLKDYFKVIQNANLKETQEIELIDIAVNTLNADGIVDYNEVKFFRLFRTLVKVSDEKMIAEIPNIPDDFLESDVFTNSYLNTLFDDYFENEDLPTFDKIDVDSNVKYVDPHEYQKED